MRVRAWFLLAFSGFALADASAQTPIQYSADVTTQLGSSLGYDASGASNASIRVHRVASTRNLVDGLRLPFSGRLIVDECAFSNNGDDGVHVDASTGAVFVNSTFVFNGSFGVNCGDLCALGQSAFLDNNTLSSSNEFSIATLRDMGGNVCDDDTCP